jgi:bacterioferritin (cytochrome b1)
MSRFIPIDKLQKLREAARNGDVKAKKILSMQLGGEEDFSEMLDSYFAPPAEPEEVQTKTKVSGVEGTDDARLQKFLDDNGITKDSPDYEDAIKEFKIEVGTGVESPVEGQETERDKFEEIIKKLMKEESDAIDDYSKAITEVMNMPEFNERQMRLALARFKEIRQDEEEHFKELSELLKSPDEIDKNLEK